MWSKPVYLDLQQLNIELSEKEIESMSKQRFKKLVQEKINMKASEYLTELHMGHSKSKYLNQEGTIQEYLTLDLLTTKQKQLLFKLRSRTTPNKTNYKNKYINDLSCSLCMDPDTVESESKFDDM